MALQKLDIDLLPRIRKLDVYAKQTALSEYIEGNWTTTFKGYGMEFSGYRNYTFGDDASIIDWKASLRSKSLLVKEYEQEKSVNVYFLIDTSNSMLFTSRKKLKAEYAAELVSSLSFAILKSGDAVGMSMFNDKIVSKLGLNVGRKVHFMITKDLYKLENYGGDYNLDNAIKTLLGTMKSGAVLVIVSDFIGLSENWYRYLRMAKRQFEVIGIMIRDPRDRELPKDSGQFILQDPYTNEELYIDTKTYAEPYKKYVEQEEKNIEKQFKAANADLLRITTDKDFYPDVMKFFKRRALTHRQ